jgi:hypothetical protein
VFGQDREQKIKKYEKKLDADLKLLINQHKSHDGFYGKHFLKTRNRRTNHSLTITSNYPTLMKTESIGSLLS